MPAPESKPSPQTRSGDPIILRSLSWDHTSRTGEAKIENALRFWYSLHGQFVSPNTCYVPAQEKAMWEGAEVEGITLKLDPILPSGQILLALVEMPSEPTNEGDPS